MGPEDDPQVPRGPGVRLHPVLARWTRIQRHHSQKQVKTKTKKQCNLVSAPVAGPLSLRHLSELFGCTPQIYLIIWSLSKLSQ